MTDGQDTSMKVSNFGAIATSLQSTLAASIPIEFSLEADGENGISEPSYLTTLDAFVRWLYEQPEVTHVTSLSDTIKRLNKNVHGDNQAYYRIPG